MVRKRASWNEAMNRSEVCGAPVKLLVGSTPKRNLMEVLRNYIVLISLVFYGKDMNDYHGEEKWLQVNSNSLFWKSSEHFIHLL
jgi:hypothetical protein